tara:strand:+ start:881 stop:1081 length:201 start_codon:yes stop_codon:yes gene_type:complete
MIWLLMVVYLNLSDAPPHIDHAEIVGSFQSEQACIKRQKEFLEQSKGVQVPDNFNLGCIPFKRKVM